MNKKTNIIIVLALLVAGASLVALPVSAENAVNGRTNLIEMLSSKFGVEQSEVESVFDEHRAGQQQYQQEKQEERLDDAVKNGEISEVQKNLILEKCSEMRQERESEKDSNLGREERRQSMEEKRSEMEAWAEENGIDLKFLNLGMGGKMGRGGPAGGRLGR